MIAKYTLYGLVLVEKDGKSVLCLPNGDEYADYNPATGAIVEGSVRKKYQAKDAKAEG